jgi:hypothetical protein
VQLQWRRLALKAPTERQRAAIEQLQRNGVAWDELLNLLRERKANQQEDCARMDDETHIRRLQGKARCLGDLIDILTPK